MSSNKELQAQLSSIRNRAKVDAKKRTPKLKNRKVSPDRNNIISEVKQRQPQTKTKTEAVPEPLERTTITLKHQDRQVLGRTQEFFIRMGRKAPSASTLVRLALLNMGETLEEDPNRLTRIFDAICLDDGRRRKR